MLYKYNSYKLCIQKILLWPSLFFPCVGAGEGESERVCHNTFEMSCLIRGCLHDTGATFAPERVHSGSLSWLYICLHDTTTKCHAGASHPGVSSPRLLYRGENFTPVRNLATVSCKRETTTHFGVKSVCRQTGTGSTCVMFAILNHMCILSAWNVPYL